MKSITLQTNYNNKLDCQCFTHIDAAPAEPISETELKQMIVEIKTADNSHAPVKARLINLLRLPLCDLTDALTLPSHAMYSNEYHDWLLQRKPNYHLKSQMGVYFYKRE